VEKFIAVPNGRRLGTYLSSAGSAWQGGFGQRIPLTVRSCAVVPAERLPRAQG